MMTKAQRWILVGGLVILAIGGCDSKQKQTQKPAKTKSEKDPLQTYSPTFQACADGTAYMVAEDSLLLWLVDGKAVKVICDDDLSLATVSERISDPAGGMYLMGEKHFWYVKAGKATKVSEVPLSQIQPQVHQVSKASLLWSLLQRFGTSVFQAGEESGYDAGLEDAAYE